VKVQVRFLNKSALFLAVVVAGFSSSASALDVSLSLSSDLRGAVQLAEGLYRSLDSDAADENPVIGSDSGSSDPGAINLDRQEPSDATNFSVRPSIHLEVLQQTYQRQNLTFGVKSELAFASFGVRYPNGISFSTGKSRVRFTEPASIKLRSFDIGMGPFVGLAMSSRLSIGGGLMYVYHDLSIKSTLGSWELIDKLTDHRIDGSLWLDYNILNGRFNPSAQPSLRLEVIHRYGESFFNVALRTSF
jgi:hypothetical protein